MKTLNIELVKQLIATDKYGKWKRSDYEYALSGMYPYYTEWSLKKLPALKELFFERALTHFHLIKGYVCFRDHDCYIVTENVQEEVKPEFTVQDAIMIQAEQLAEWKGKLNTECYNALEAFILASNKDTVNTDGIKRGYQMDEFIANYTPVVAESVIESGTKAFKGELRFMSPINLEYSALPNVVPLIESTESVFDVNIHSDGTGYAEWEIEELDHCECIGLWFNGNELTDYDGVFEMPVELVDYLEQNGYNVDYAR